MFSVAWMDLALKKERSAALTAQSSSEDKRDLEKWGRSNCLRLMIMKRATRETFMGAMSKEANSKGFREEIEQRSAKNKKADT